MRQKLKNSLPLALIVTMLCVYTLFQHPTPTYVGYVPDVLQVRRTVAHSDVPRTWEKLFVDEENDVAYYIINSEFCEVAVGEKVLVLESGTATVVATSQHGFYLDITGLHVAPGMSGSPVMLNDTTIGYVSSLKSTGYLYCIYK